MSTETRAHCERADEAIALGEVQRASNESGALRVALVGNPNTGKTTLFNRLCGLRHKTGNFPGTTQEARVGVVGNTGHDSRIELTDLPGIYSLELDQSEAEVCRSVLAGALAPAGRTATAPDAVCVVVDATNLERNLLLVGEVLRRRLPTVVALNMIDLARAHAARGSGMSIEPEALSEQLGCRVVATCGRSGHGVSELIEALRHARIPNVTPPGTRDGLEQWATNATTLAVAATHRVHAPSVRRARIGESLTDRIDRVTTHPVLGLVVFACVMFALFWSIFSLATIPMNIIEGVFGLLSDRAKGVLPRGTLNDFLTDGVLAGVGGTVVFLPQIVLLFFLISLLEDTGYLARAAFLVDRFMRPFGLSGYAFVPLLSSHACALPGIMACRGIPDAKERLAVILVAPFMSCSARIPVYVLLTTILFAGKPAQQALAFIACYATGACAGLFSAMVARRTILPGKGRAMVLELPTYKMPSVRTALLASWDRGLVFLKKAGTAILAISIVLWWLSAYPKSDPSPEATSLRESAKSIRDDAIARGRSLDEPNDKYHGRPRGFTPPSFEELAARAESRANAVEARHQMRGSFAGRLGRLLQPVFAPLGFDWQLTVGVITSFAAREVFASTMAIITSGQSDAASEGVIAEIARSTRDDGVTRIFTPAASWSLLIYFVLAMQCLPTLAVTAREAGGVRWALLQLAWMSGLAYLAAMLVYQLMK